MKDYFNPFVLSFFNVLPLKSVAFRLTIGSYLAFMYIVKREECKKYTAGDEVIININNE